MKYLLDLEDLPADFRYPEIFTRVLSLHLVELEPWHFLEGLRLTSTRHGLRDRYPMRDLVPFAYRQDNDDVACWDRVSAQGVLIVHDFASPGYEVNESFDSFEAWFRRAVDDMLDW